MENSIPGGIQSVWVKLRFSKRYFKKACVHSRDDLSLQCKQPEGLHIWKCKNESPESHAKRGRLSLSPVKEAKFYFWH